MAHTIFVASGLNFAVDDYLRGSRFIPKSVFYKGTIPTLDNPQNIPRPDSGFVVLIDSDNEATVLRQFQKAFDFLAAQEKELLKMRKYGVDNMLFDFGVPRSTRTLDHYVYLPPELLKAMSRFEMGLTISIVLVAQG
jgi:hypothetical protein